MRYLLSFFAVIGLVVVVFILIFRGLTGDEGVKNLKALTEYADTDTVMQFTMTGPIVSEQQRSAIRITIGNNENKIDILQGYDEVVSATKSYPSNSAAYGTFLRALDLLGYNRGSENPNLKDERGYCADGNLFYYDIKNGDNQIQRYWKTSCNEGNFSGKVQDIEDLFKAQIPDFDTFTQDVEL